MAAQFWKEPGAELRRQWPRQGNCRVHRRGGSHTAAVAPGMPLSGAVDYAHDVLVRRGRERVAHRSLTAAVACIFSIDPVREVLVRGRSGRFAELQLVGTVGRELY